LITATLLVQFEIVENVVDNMRFFHVKNTACGLCVVPVPAPLHRSFRF
jgi:hypothetical protein